MMLRRNRVPSHSRATVSSSPLAAIASHRIRPIHNRESIFFRAASVEASSSSEKKQANAGNKKQQGKKDGAAKIEEAITPKSVDFSKWYLDIVAKAALADYGPVRGTMVIRPYGYALWEAIQSNLDAKFKATGHENAYFPQLIPYSFIAKEAAHVEGFAPELALVTKGGGKDLEEPLVVRPTSETIVNHMFAQWVQSYRDLPLLLNQEGHTAHATADEAEEEALRMIRIYEEFATLTAAMPVVVGRKSRIESFAGANCTYTIEAMMGDKKALQAGTSHNLGTNFAKAFSTQFLDQEGTRQYVHQTSWGVSTRMIGGIIMTHGDDKGLRLPPLIAPIQAIIIPIVKKDEERDKVMAAVTRLELISKAAGFRVKVDADMRQTPGWKYNHWEMKGVPVRIEVGPRDVEANACVSARRDRPGKEGKEVGISMEPELFVRHLGSLLSDIQINLLEEARAFRDANIVDVKSYEELKATVSEGRWARCGWSGSDEDEKRVKEETQATLRCYPFDQPLGEHTCIMTGEKAQVAIFAKSY